MPTTSRSAGGHHHGPADRGRGQVPPWTSRPATPCTLHRPGRLKGAPGGDETLGTPRPPRPADLPRLQRHDTCRSALSLRRCCPYLTREFGNPSSSPHLRRGRRRRPRPPATRSPARRSAPPTRWSSPAAGRRPTRLPSAAPSWPSTGGTGRARHHAGHRASRGAGRVRRTGRFHGVAVTYLPVDRHGRVDPAEVAAAITPTPSWCRSCTRTTKPARSSR